MPKRATIRDVAQAAGVTHGTVSRALNQDPRVKADTLQRVLAAARKLGYVPNQAARHFQRGRTGNIGILCDSGPWMIYNHYFGALIAGFIQAAQNGGFRSLIYLPHEQLPQGETNLDRAKIELQGLEELLDGRVDCAVVVGGRSRTHEGLKAVEQAGLPLVLLGHNLAVPGHFELRSGAVERMRLATQSLIKRHGRAPAMLGLYEGSTYNQVSLAAWSEVISEAGLPSAPFYQLAGEEIAGERALLEIGRKAFSSGAPALICSDLSQAMTFFELVRVGKLKRPEGFELLTFGPIAVDRITALPDWVHFINADLLAEGARAFALTQKALDKEAAQAWAIKWSLLVAKND